MCAKPDLSKCKPVWQFVVVAALMAGMGASGSVLAQDAAADSAQQQDKGFIAGSTPHQRPANAPTITQSGKPEGWYGRALYGVSAPYPHSLRFLEDQGNWYTPFNWPGMPGYYDIRHWGN